MFAAEHGSSAILYKIETCLDRLAFINAGVDDTNVGLAPPTLVNRMPTLDRPKRPVENASRPQDVWEVSPRRRRPQPRLHGRFNAATPVNGGSAASPQDQPRHDVTVHPEFDDIKEIIHALPVEERGAAERTRLFAWAHAFDFALQQRTTKRRSPRSCLVSSHIPCPRGDLRSLSWLPIKTRSFAGSISLAFLARWHSSQKTSRENSLDVCMSGQNSMLVRASPPGTSPPWPFRKKPKGKASPKPCSLPLNYGRAIRGIPS